MTPARVAGRTEDLRDLVGIDPQDPVVPTRAGFDEIEPRISGVGERVVPAHALHDGTEFSEASMAFARGCVEHVDGKAEPPG